MSRPRDFILGQETLEDRQIELAVVVVYPRVFLVEARLDQRFDLFPVMFEACAKFDVDGHPDRIYVSKRAAAVPAAQARPTYLPHIVVLSRLATHGREQLRQKSLKRDNVSPVVVEQVRLIPLGVWCAGNDRDGEVLHLLLLFGSHVSEAEVMEGGEQTELLSFALGVVTWEAVLVVQIFDIEIEHALGNRPAEGNVATHLRCSRVADEKIVMAGIIGRQRAELVHPHANLAATDKLLETERHRHPPSTDVGAEFKVEESDFGEVFVGDTQF
jgi:hypothetical protein